MPLKLKLSAHERLVVNGAVIVNGGGRTSLIIRNYAHIMREKDVLQEADANTPTRRLYFLVQAMLMRPPPPAELFDSFATAMSQLAAAYVKPQNLEALQDVARLVDAGDFYKALMRLHPLIDYEAELLQVPTHEWRRSKQPPPSFGAPSRSVTQELAAAE
jgi:flagellar protein FlbT